MWAVYFPFGKAATRRHLASTNGWVVQLSLGTAYRHPAAGFYGFLVFSTLPPSCRVIRASFSANDVLAAIAGLADVLLCFPWQLALVNCFHCYCFADSASFANCGPELSYSSWLSSCAPNSFFTVLFSCTFLQLFAIFLFVSSNFRFPCFLFLSSQQLPFQISRVKGP